MELLAVVIIAGILWYLFRNRKKPIDISILPEQFIVIDLETTGLKAEQHEIIEIGAVRVNRDQSRHDTFQVFIKPTKKLPKKITKITGITQDVLDKEGVSLEQALNELQAFIGDHRVVFFNAEFDTAFLRKAAASCGLTLKNPVSCALLMARRAWPRRKSYRLTELAKDGGISTAGAHRALDDCRMTIIVYGAAAAQLRRVD